MKKILLVLFTLIVGLIAGRYFWGDKDELDSKEQAEIIVEKIEEVNKLITLEGNFAEVYTFEQSQNLFFDLIPIPKKAIIIAKAKSFVAYDLSKMGYRLDKKTKTLYLENIPEPEIIVEPTLKFYDLEANIIPFNKKELSKLNQRAIELLREEAEKESFIELAEKNLQLNIEKIILTATNLGWDVKTEKVLADSKSN